MPTSIEWVKNPDGTQGETFNPVMGCTPISSGCDNCYARTMMKRFKRRIGWPTNPGRVTLYPDRLEQPFRWKKPKSIFVCSMSDLFHDDVPFEFISAVFGVMAANPQHKFMVLTKRASRMERWFEKTGNGGPRERAYYCLSQLGIETHIGEEWPLPNVHIGASVENQDSANGRIPLLLKTPAAKRFVSAEPLLGPVDLFDCGAVDSDSCSDSDTQTPSLDFDRGLVDQVIVGAETGPGARPMDLNWARSIRDQCVATGTPFFFKRDSNGNRELDGEIWEGMIK